MEWVWRGRGWAVEGARKWRRASVKRWMDVMVCDFVNGPRMRLNVLQIMSQR